MKYFQGNPGRAVLACSLFLHAGYIGAVTVAAGLIELVAAEGNWLWALALIVFGGILATASWRRARTIVERADQPPPRRLMRQPDLPARFERRPRRAWSAQLLD